MTWKWFKIFHQKSGRTWTCTINPLQDSGNYVALTLSGMTFCPQIPNLKGSTGSHNKWMFV
jgi:hypothetical protein